MSGGLDIVRAALPRRVHYGGRIYNVRPPSVREALEILHFLAESEDEADREYLGLILRKWLGGQLGRALDTAPTGERTLALRGLLFGGADREVERETERDAPIEQEDDSPARVPAWDELFFEYCGEFGLDPFSAYERTPFPFLVGAARYLSRLRAKRTLRDISVASSPHLDQKSRRKFLRETRRAAYAGVAKPAEATLSDADYAKERSRLAAAMSGIG